MCLSKCSAEARQAFAWAAALVNLRNFHLFLRLSTDKFSRICYIKEVLIKSGMQITQTDFSSGGCRPQDCTKVTQEYLMYFKEFSCNKTENMQVRCVPRFIQRFLKCIKNRNGENGGKHLCRKV